jgi:aminopeptidase N
METIADELAHQWWGNKLGWDSYRDQWLSEALADFSSVQFVAKQSDRPSVYLHRHAGEWKRSLDRVTKDGRTVESLGPVVLGERLSSSRSSAAYSAVVYDKGSVVFSMLARLLGEEPLAGKLRTLAEKLAHGTIDTETFIAALGRMSGQDLRWFADQFIYGTGIPEVYYTFRFSPGKDGEWVVEGEARQVVPADYRYTLLRTGSGTWT